MATDPVPPTERRTGGRPARRPTEPAGKLLLAALLVVALIVVVLIILA